MPFITDIYSDESLILAACTDPNRILVNDPDPQNFGKRSEEIIRYGAKAVIKSGRNVTEVESQNQAHAHKILAPAIVRVPQVYHYFTRGSTYSDWCGYLVMEYFPSATICPHRPSQEQFTPPP